MTQYKRVLLKISGGALAGDSDGALDGDVLEYVCRQISDLRKTGVSIGVVVGGGNYFRGRSAGKWGMDRITTDYIGMLGTVMNALAIVDYVKQTGSDAIVQGSVEIAGVMPRYDRGVTGKALDDGKVVVFGGGTGHPFFSTDTTAALRACEIGANALFKATDVDGVYDKNPHQFEDAVKFDNITYAEVLKRNLQVLDATATALCYENKIPIVVFNVNHPGNICRAAKGENIGTYVG